MPLFRVVPQGQTYELGSRASRRDALGAYEAAFHALVKKKPKIVPANGRRDEALE